MSERELTFRYLAEMFYKDAHEHFNLALYEEHGMNILTINYDAYLAKMKLYHKYIKLAKESK